MLRKSVATPTFSVSSATLKFQKVKKKISDRFVRRLCTFFLQGPMVIHTFLSQSDPEDTNVHVQLIPCGLINEHTYQSDVEFKIKSLQSFRLSFFIVLADTI